MPIVAGEVRRGGWGRGRGQSVSSLEQTGRKIETTMEFNSTADELLEAVKENKINQVRRILASNKSIINSRDSHGRTSLYIAVKQGHGEIVRMLLLNGADISLQASDSTKPLDLLPKDDPNDEIRRLIYNVSTTKWRPNEDPQLLREEYNSILSPVAHELDMIEKTQIQDILDGAGLGEYFHLFDQNKIKFLDFVRLDEGCLMKMGMTDALNRAKLAEILSDMSDRKSCLPQFMSKMVSSYEVESNLVNMRSHLLAMKNELYFVGGDLPSGKLRALKSNIDSTCGDRLLQGIDSVRIASDNLIQSVHKFCELATGKVCEESRSGFNSFIIPYNLIVGFLIVFVSILVAMMWFL